MCEAYNGHWRESRDAQQGRKENSTCVFRASHGGRRAQPAHEPASKKHRSEPKKRCQRTMSHEPSTDSPAFTRRDVGARGLASARDHRAQTDTEYSAMLFLTLRVEAPSDKNTSVLKKMRGETSVHAELATGGRGRGEQKVQRWTHVKMMHR